MIIISFYCSLHCYSLPNCETIYQRKEIVDSKRQITVSVFMSLKLFFDNFFNHKYTLTYTECFYASIQMTTFFPLSPVNVVNYVNWFSNLNVLCTPRINSTWSWYIFFVHCWNWLANISFRVFSYILMSEIHLQVSFFIMSLLIWVSRLYYLIKLIRRGYLLFKI